MNNLMSTAVPEKRASQDINRHDYLVTVRIVPNGEKHIQLPVAGSINFHEVDMLSMSSYFAVCKFLAEMGR